MRKKTGVAAVILTFLFVTVLSSVCLSSSELETINIYKNSIEKQIAKCNAKIRFIDSDSNNLRQYGLRELRKAEFFNNAKEMLIIKMIENQIDAKEYKIQYFINSRFYEMASE